jgi:HPt (histidine-containing phosphotransfer) domain-containing protein
VLPGSLPGIDLQDGLSHLAGKVSAYLGLLRRFPERQGSCVESIRSSLGRGDTVEAIRLAHTLKGVAGSLGAAALSAAAREVELALKDGRLAEGMLGTLHDALAGGPRLSRIAPKGACCGRPALRSGRADCRLLERLL